jgi:hypothetical protein
MKQKFWLFGVMAAVFALSITRCGSSPKAAPSKQAAAPDLTGVTSYYVRADGDDKNAGISEAAPFKTLQRAVEAAAKTQVKTITVIGTIAEEITITDSGSDEILITGKADGRETERALLSPPSTNVSAIIVIGGVSNIRLEHMIVTEGGPRAIRGITVSDKESILILGQGAVVSGNGGDGLMRKDNGGGIMSSGTLIMQGNAAVIGNIAGSAGGVVVIGGTFLMKDDARIAENTANDSMEFRGGGGVVVAGAAMTMEGNAVIENNRANSGGGVFLQGGELLMRGNAAIKNNTANTESNSLLYGGGGIYSYGSTITLQGSSSIAGNSAAYGGGVYLKMSELTQEGENVSGNTATTEGPDTYENNA